jgi:DNA-binding response OmpR family regulator
MAHKILIVDDDEAWGAMLNEALSAAGYEVKVCYDPLGGSAVIKSFIPDIVIMDIDMPAGGGRAMFGGLRRNAATARLPVLVVSGSSEPTRIWSALGVQPDPTTWFLPKPVEIAKLRKAVANLLAPPGAADGA